MTIKKIILKGEDKSMGSLSLGLGKSCGIWASNKPGRLDSSPTMARIA